MMFKTFLQNFSVTKLRDDLDYWIFIGCGDDIVILKDQRKEYQHLVKQNRMKCVEWFNGQCSAVGSNDDIPKSVLLDLNRELYLPWYKRPTFWHLVNLYFKKKMRIL